MSVNHIYGITCLKKSIGFKETKFLVKMSGVWSTITELLSYDRRIKDVKGK